MNDLLLKFQKKEGAMKFYRPVSMIDFSYKIKEYFRIIRDILIEKGIRTEKDFRNQHKNMVVVNLDKFTIVLLDEATEHHGNASLDIFNADGDLIDKIILFHVIDDKKPNKTAFSPKIILDDEIVDYKAAYEKLPV